MERSSSNLRAAVIVHLDRVAVAGLAAGLVLYVMPVWAERRLPFAFWLTLAATALHIYTSREKGRAPPS